MSMKRTIVAATSVAALGLQPLPTLAQSAVGSAAARSAADSIEEVVVTARRREENLQVVPVSVTVIGGEQLAQKGILSTWDLAGHVPSLAISSQGNMTKSFQAGIRAVRATSFLIQDDPPVGTYYAESAVAHPWGFGDTFFDIQSVQVLKGPQGTLFGRNTTGGAILIEPNKPSFEEGFGGVVKATVGNFNLAQLNGTINIPLNDVAALRIAGEHKERDGYTKNILSGQKRDGVGNDAIRVSLLLKPTKDITSNTIIDYLDEDSSPSSSQVTNVYGPNGGFGLSGSTSPANTAFNQLTRLIGEQKARNPWDVAMIGGANTAQDQLSPNHCDPSSPLFVANHKCRRNMLPRETLENFGLLNNTAIDFGGVTVKNIFAYRKMKHFNEDSATFPFGSPTPTTSLAAGGTAFQQNKQSQVSEELQFQGKAFDQRLNWVTGLFYMREWGSESSPSYTNSASWSVTEGTAVNIAKGLFAQGDYAVSDKLKVTLGVRRNWDKRIANDTSYRQVGAGAACQTFNLRNGVDVLDTYPNCSLSQEKDWKAWTWTMAVDYRLTDATMIYGSHSRGYKAGGYSLRSHRPAQYAYNPEFILNTEIGIKSDWSLFDRPIRTNLTVYNMDYNNMQLQATVAGSNPVRTYTDNVGKSKINGIEFEATYKPTQRLELSGFYSYTNPRYLEYQNSIGRVGAFDYGVVDLSGRPFGYINKKSLGLSMAYNLPLDESVGNVNVRADASFQSKWLVDNTQAGLLGLPASATIVPGVAGFTMVPNAGYGILNLRADWSRPFGHPIDLGFFVTNAGDKAYFQGGAGVNGMVTQPIAPPRMFGIELSYKFGEGFRPRD